MSSHRVSSVVSRLLNGNKKGKKTESVSPTSASGLKYPQLEKLEEVKPKKKKSKSVSCFVGESGSPRGSTENLQCIEQIDTEKLTHAQNGRKTQPPASCFVETSVPLVEISSVKTIEKPKPLPRKLKYTQRPASCVVESLSQPLLASTGSSLQTLSELTFQQERGESGSFSSLSPQPSHRYEQKRINYDLKSYFPPANFTNPKPSPRSMCALTCDVDVTRATTDGEPPARSPSLLPTLDPREAVSTPRDEESACLLPRVRAHPLGRSQPLPILRTFQVAGSTVCFYRIC
ncbi:uncharacterized protein LOC112560708 isoform X1 [Pomacea canaliculata]|uniref:uncharacterized protein LOC112560708 isoform X1 n=1 Tax=Pomacea canaliculata TaxID=400727 RepID=UPI000D730D6C|nr:uncharacterized protein LOC112560708 isoform X1 [Pomacea canaliculata]